MFAVVVSALMVLAIGVAAVTFVAARRAGASVAAWPFFALAAFVLIESRLLVDTPSLTDALQANPSDETRSYISDRVSGLVIGAGVTMLGIACAAVFFAGLARRAWEVAASSIAAWLIAIGGAVTVAVVGTGAGMFSILGDAAGSDRAPTTVAAVYTIFDSLAYIGFTAVGLVTAGVALAALREHVFSRFVGWVSAVASGLFLLCAFLPFVSWAPALLWLLVVGIALVREEGRKTGSPVITTQVLERS
jgi:hypothetical protein